MLYFCASDPCESSRCGTGAECLDAGGQAICQCPDGLEGNPLHACVPPKPADPCDPNPCAAHAQCRPVAGGQAECACKPGFAGDPVYTGCVKEPEVPQDPW